MLLQTLTIDNKTKGKMRRGDTVKTFFHPANNFFFQTKNSKHGGSNYQTNPYIKWSKLVEVQMVKRWTTNSAAPGSYPVDAML